MKGLLFIASLVFFGATGIDSNNGEPQSIIAAQEEPALEGAWRLCSIESYEGDALTGAMTVQKDYIEFKADGVCAMLISKQEKEYTYDSETGALMIGPRKAKVVRLTSDELLWEEVSGGTTLRYCLRRTGQ